MMIARTLISLVTLAVSLPGFAQDTTVPDSVRQMIERSQGSSQYEQMARMQVQVQYREFLDSLTGDTKHKAQVEDALVEVLSERAELSARVTQGRGSTADLEAVSSPDYLRQRLAPMLSADELAALDNRRSGPTDAQLQQEYAVELARVASSLSEAEQQLVLDTLIRHLRADNAVNADARQLSVEELVDLQMRSFIRAQTELQPKFSGQALDQVNAFIAQLQSNLYRNRSMLEANY